MKEELVKIYEKSRDIAYGIYNGHKDFHSVAIDEDGDIIVYFIDYESESAYLDSRTEVVFIEDSWLTRDTDEVVSEVKVARKKAEEEQRVKDKQAHEQYLINEYARKEQNERATYEILKNKFEPVKYTNPKG